MTRESCVINQFIINYFTQIYLDPPDRGRQDNASLDSAQGEIPVRKSGRSGDCWRSDEDGGLLRFIDSMDKKHHNEFT